MGSISTKKKLLEALAIAGTTISLCLVANIVLAVLTFPLLVFTGKLHLLGLNILHQFGTILFLFICCAMLSETIND